MFELLVMSTRKKTLQEKTTANKTGLNQFNPKSFVCPTQSTNLLIFNIFLYHLILANDSCLKVFISSPLNSKDVILSPCFSCCSAEVLLLHDFLNTKSVVKP